MIESVQDLSDRTLSRTPSAEREQYRSVRRVHIGVQTERVYGCTTPYRGYTCTQIPLRGVAR